MAEVLAVFMRWLHIASMAVLVGGMFYGRLVMKATSATVAPDASGKLSDAAATLFRPGVLACIAALVLSGIYNVLTTPGHTTRYHVWLGIKLLLVLHLFAAAILATRPAHHRRLRLMGSAAISGLIIILISAYLRRIF
jgi:uncharacterized membrane protein